VEPGVDKIIQVPGLVVVAVSGACDQKGSNNYGKEDFLKQVRRKEGRKDGRKKVGRTRLS
jgi:hypothetical protein